MRMKTSLSGNLQPCLLPRYETSYIGCLAKDLVDLKESIPCQVFYHLGELDDALSYALGAGPLFDVNEQSEYVQTLIGVW